MAALLGVLVSLLAPRRCLDTAVPRRPPDLPPAVPGAIPWLIGPLCERCGAPALVASGTLRRLPRAPLPADAFGGAPRRAGARARPQLEGRRARERRCGRRSPRRRAGVGARARDGARRGAGGSRPGPLARRRRAGGLSPRRSAGCGAGRSAPAVLARVADRPQRGSDGARGRRTRLPPSPSGAPSGAHPARRRRPHHGRHPLRLRGAAPRRRRDRGRGGDGGPGGRRPPRACPARVAVR